MWHVLIYVICSVTTPFKSVCHERKKASSNPDTTGTVEAKSQATQNHTAGSSVRATLSQPHSSCFSSCFSLLHRRHLTRSPTSLSPASLQQLCLTLQPPLQRVPNHKSSFTGSKNPAACLQEILFPPIIFYRKSST